VGSLGNFSKVIGVIEEGAQPAEDKRGAMESVRIVVVSGQEIETRMSQGKGGIFRG